MRQMELAQQKAMQRKIKNDHEHNSRCSCLRSLVMRPPGNRHDVLPCWSDSELAQPDFIRAGSCPS
jgi:hypothetical protein